MTRRLLLSLAVCVSCVAPALAQAPKAPAKQAGAQAPRLPENVTLETDIEYGKAGDHVLKLDMVRPKEASDKPLPVIAFIHGGGWRNGDKRGGIGNVAPLVATGNYIGVSIGYRLSGEAIWPAQIHDCKAAIRWLRANASKYNIAVVDISYIFKNHKRFKTAMDSMKKEMEGIEGELKGDREKIAALEQERNTFGAGTAEYKQRDEEVARQMAEFNLKMGKLRKDFLEREAKVYYQTYLEVVDAVKYYAKRQQIGLVLRFNGESVDPNRRDDVLREINKPVVVQDQIDITPDILALLNRDQQGAPAANPSTPQNPQTARPAGAPSQLPPR